MGYKVKREQPWQIFWKKVFDYILEHNLSAFDTIFYVLQTPSIYHLQDQRLLRFLRRIASFYNALDREPFFWAVLYVIRIFDLYTQFKSLPRKNYEGLERLYNLIMKDFRQSKSYTFEEAYNTQDNIAAAELQPRSWYIIDSILKGQNAEEVRKILEKAQKEEKEFKYTPTELHIVVQDYLAGKTRQSFENMIQKWAGRDVTDEEIMKELGGKETGEGILMSKELARLFYALLLFYSHAEAEFKNYEDALKRCQEDLEMSRNTHRGDVKLLLEEIEHLRMELAEAKPQIKKIKIDEKDKIEMLKREYEARIEELKEEVETLKDMLRMAEKEEKEEELKPFEKPVYIAYFGIENDALFEYLASFNVFVKPFSPFKPPEALPSLPIVLNIDAASHKVWWEIRDRKPLLVSGSNKFLLAKRIITWLRDITSTC